MSFEFLVSKIQKNNFLLIGRAGIDIYPDPPGTKTENAKSFVTHLGGSSANMGVQLTLFGGNCNLLTRVSDDALGRLAINQLNHYGVKNKLVEFEKNESRISFAIVETTVKDAMLGSETQHPLQCLHYDRSKIKDPELLRLLHEQWQR